MAHLAQLTRGATVPGILPDGLVTIIDVKWIGTVAVEATYKDAAGRLGSELLYRDREPSLEITAEGQPWSFDGDCAQFRLVSEARRIQLAYLFDPLLAVHTLVVEPLPHQITTAYGAMLRRQPLRSLLANDPRAGRGNYGVPFRLPFFFPVDSAVGLPCPVRPISGDRQGGGSPGLRNLRFSSS
jgi:hypothetical protein